MTDQENNVEEQSIINCYYDGQGGCEESILLPPLPYRPPHLPRYFHPVQQNNNPEIIALDKNVIVKILNFKELFQPNQIQNFSNENFSNECVDKFELGLSINSSVTGVVVKGIVINKGPEVPPDWPVLEGDFVAIKSYSTVFEENNYVSVNYKSVLNKFNDEFPVALLDKVCVQVLSIYETVGSKSNLLQPIANLPGYAKAIILSVGHKVPAKVAITLGSGGVFVVDKIQNIFKRRYWTTVNYKTIKTKLVY